MISGKLSSIEALLSLVGPKYEFSGTVWSLLLRSYHGVDLVDTIFCINYAFIKLVPGLYDLYIPIYSSKTSVNLDMEVE